MDLIDVISAAVGNDPAARRKALRDLAGRGPTVAATLAAAWRARPIWESDQLVPVILRWPPELVARLFTPFLQDEAPGIAVRAAAILGGVHDEAAVPPLAEELGRSGRSAAARALGRNGSVAGIEPLLQLFSQVVGSREFLAVDERDPSDAELIAVVVRALGRLGHTGHAGWLIEILQAAEEMPAREAAAIALREVPTAGALGALAAALSSSNGHVRGSSLRALWSYRTIEAVDPIVNTALSDDLLTDAAALLYDVVALDVAEDPTGWVANWSACRAALRAGTCLLARKPITPHALIERIRRATRVDQALGELELYYGFRSRWDARLNEPASLLEELDRWVGELELRFAPGRMYRFGREVPNDRFPAAHT